MNRKTAITALASLALAGTAGLLLAGPLSPPAGPISASYKTIAEVEPRTAVNTVNTPGDASSLYVIYAPGSYYLTENLQGVAGKHGIKILASKVTIDLNGFRLQGGTGATSGIIVSGANLNDITIENGSVTSWGGHGIDLATAAPTNSIVRNVHSDNNVGSGIRVHDDSMVFDCAANWNGGYGFDIYTNCTITRCQASHNVNNGFDAGIENTITECSARENTGVGIHTATGSVVDRCRAAANAGGGMDITGGNGRVSGCTADANTLFGIRVSARCFVLQNSSTATMTGGVGTGAGILITNADNRIEGNSCLGNNAGIVASSGGNLIVKNSCSGNATNWNFVAGNAYGPIVATPAGAAVNGSTAASALGSTDPNANFTY